MTDRELLELAAKAAGVDIAAHDLQKMSCGLNSEIWNPLTDDGDALLLDGERLTKNTASRRAHCGQRTAQRILGDIHARMHLVRIVAWERSKGSPLPVYAVAVCDDAPRPARLTPCEARAAQRQCPERRALEASIKRIRRAAAKPVDLNMITVLSHGRKSQSPVHV